MTVVTAPPVRFDTGRVISAGCGLVVRQAGWLLLLAFVFGYLPGVVAAWANANLVGAAPQRGVPEDMGTVFGRLGMSLLIATFSAALGWLLQAVVAVVAVADAAGDSAWIGARLRAFTGRSWFILLAGVAGGLGMSLGLMLLVVPGVLLSLAWMVAPAVFAIEETTFLGGFRRSAELTRGSRGALFVISLLFGLASIALLFAARTAAGVPLLLTGYPPPLVAFVLQPAITAGLAVVMAAVVAAAYLELRGVKEGLTTGGLAAVFD